MTTDGIHEYLDVDELEEFVLGDISEHTLKALFEKAWLNGSVDDKTIIVMDIVYQCV
jgi:serine/threonine protein phosphatase PrpC